MILKIKGVRKYRITYDDLCWVIQMRMPNQKPPNDWVNKYWCTTLESLFTTLVKIGIDPTKITNIKKASAHVATLERNLKALIQELFDKTEGKIPETKKKALAKKTRKRKKK